VVDAGFSPAFLVGGVVGGDVGRLDAVEVQMQAAGELAPGCGG
jgi:hypothetical protein